MDTAQSKVDRVVEDVVRDMVRPGDPIHAARVARALFRAAALTLAPHVSASGLLPSVLSMFRVVVGGMQRRGEFREAIVDSTLAT